MMLCSKFCPVHRSPIRANSMISQTCTLVGSSRRFVFHWIFANGLCLFLALPLRASDHADPIHLPTREGIFDDGKPNQAATARLAGNTAIFSCFPSAPMRNWPIFHGRRARARSCSQRVGADQGARGDSLRASRASKGASARHLSAYTIRSTWISQPLLFDKADELARYGGSIPDPEKISLDVTIEINSTTTRR